MAGWFAQNAPKSGGWFAKNAPGATAPPTVNKLIPPVEPVETKGVLPSFWESTGAPLIDLGKNLVNVLSPDYGDEARAHLLQAGKNAVRGAFQNTFVEPFRMSQSIAQGDFPSAVHHYAGSIPVVGAPVQEIMNDLGEQKYDQAFGHALGLGTDILLPEAISAVPAISRVAGATTRGAYRGVRNAPVGPTALKSVTGATTGAGLGYFLDGPMGAVHGAEIGGAIPAVVEGVRGAKAGFKQGMRSLKPSTRQTPGWVDLNMPQVTPIEASAAPTTLADVQLPSGRVPGKPILGPKLPSKTSTPAIQIDAAPSVPVSMETPTPAPAPVTVPVKARTWKEIHSEDVPRHLRPRYRAIEKLHGESGASDAWAKDYTIAKHLQGLGKTRTEWMNMPEAEKNAIVTSLKSPGKKSNYGKLGAEERRGRAGSDIIVDVGNILQHLQSGK